MQSVIVLLFSVVTLCGPGVHADTFDGLVGRWDFDDGTGKDLSESGSHAVLGGAFIYSLGKGRACLKIVPDTEPMRISAMPDSPLAISRGTICLWLNVGWDDSGTILEYSNDAVQLRVYRRHLQPRFRGDNRFNMGGNVLGDDWPQFLLREDAFYPHPRAVVGEGEWHHFAVAYDDQSKRIVGWRDGEMICVVDLSTVAVEPLKREGLEEIVTGNDFAGFIDDLRIYNCILTDSDVRGIFESTKSIYAGRSDTIPNDSKMEVYAYRQQDRSLYSAWLQHAPAPGRQEEDILRRIMAEGADSTIQTGANELAKAFREIFGQSPSIDSSPSPGAKVILGTPATSSWVREKFQELNLERVQHDGYVIKTLKDGKDTMLVVAANVPAGVTFGVFDLIRRIQLGQDLSHLDVTENPRNPIRMVNHWDTWRGLPYDDWHGKKINPYNWEGNRNNSIYSWEELRTGRTKRIRDWARLLASAGWNAVCPTEINWEFRNNFMDHLDEVEILAGIFRDYGIRLYWSPSYILALDKKTAETLYSRAPDFGGYLLKLGSEKQNGDPRPRMVNRIADNLKPYGGYALVRTFVYGNYRYTPKPNRNLIPYDIFAPEDGNYRDNVILISKGSPLDWDFAAPISPLDGAVRKNLYGCELVIAKSWPVSWIEKWKWWMEQDNYRNGPGHLNKFETTCILGVSMVSPAPAWTSCPLNMVNYYGMGRLAWSPDISADHIYTEWIRLTFGDDPEVLDGIKAVLLLSDDVTRKLCMYRGYRGIWIDTSEDNMVQGKTPHTVSREGIGVTSHDLRERLLDQYAPGLRAIYGDRIKGEEFLPYFHFVDYDYRLSNGRTVIHDIYANLDEAVHGAQEMCEIWRKLEGKIDQHRFRYTLDNLNHYVETARETRNKMVECFEEKTGREYNKTMSGKALDGAQR
ncbi:MAG: alpha-glucuronidase family glycosyl hydrolase [Planctomycetota bacterium]